VKTIGNKTLEITLEKISFIDEIFTSNNFYPICKKAFEQNPEKIVCNGPYCPVQWQTDDNVSFTFCLSLAFTIIFSFIYIFFIIAPLHFHCNINTEKVNIR
jgi:hypothetical protein